MVAIVTVNEITGPSGAKVYTPITNKVRLFSDDVATDQDSPQTTNPIIIPSLNYYYSFWKAVCLDLAGSSFTITNIRHYSNGDFNTGLHPWTYGTGGQLRRGNRDSGDHGCPDASYQQASGNAGVTGYAIEVAGPNGHAYYNTQTTPTADVNNDTSPVVIDSGPYTVAGKTNHIVLQVKVASNATQGTQYPKQLTWEYDEQ